MSNASTEQGTGAPAGEGGGSGQEPPAQGQAGQEPAGQGQGTEPPASSTTGTIDLDAITDPALRSFVEAQQKAAKDAREEAARYRVERNNLQRANETAEQAATREAQEAQEARQQETERLATLERENRDLRVGYAVTDAARNARAHNPTVVSQMIAPRVTFGEDGQPNNVAALVEALRTSDPYLFKRTRSDAGDGTGDGDPTPTGGVNDLIRGSLNARRGRTNTTS